MNKDALYVWKTAKYGDEVERFRLIGQTAAFVTIETEWFGRKSHRREAKNSDSHRYHATELDALQFLAVRASRKLESLKRETNDMNSRLHQLQKRLRALGVTIPERTKQ